MVSPSHSKLNRFIPGLTDLFGVLIALAFLLVVPSLSGDPGTGWHLQAGKLISEIPSGFSGPGITMDQFLFPGEAKAWVNNQWLADWLLFNVKDVFGWSGLNSLVALNVFAIYFLVILSSFSRASLSPLVSAVVLFLLLFMGAVQWIVRPVMFSFLLFAVVCHLVLLERRNLISRSKLVILPLLFAVWCNLHPAFILGIAVLGLVMASCFAEFLLEGKKLKETGVVFYSVVLFFCLIASLCNPSGVGLWQNIFGLAGNEFFMNLNSEWLSPDFHIFFFFFFLLSLLTGVLLLLSGFGQKLNYTECGLLLIFASASLMQRRYIPFFSIACALPLGLLIQFWWESQRTRSGSLVKAFQAIEQKNVLRSRARWTFYFFLLAIFVNNFFSDDARFAPEMLPAKIITALKSGPEKARILHSPDLGGSITFQLWPQQLASIDDRNQLNGQQAYLDFLDLFQVTSNWEEKLRAGNYDWLLVDQRSALFKLMSNTSVQQRTGYQAGVQEGALQLFQKRQG